MPNALFNFAMKIKIPHEVEQRIWHWVEKADFEVSGFGKVSYDSEQNAFIVHSVCLLKQEGGAAHTDIDPGSLSRAQYLLRDSPGDLRFWWHSHVNMGVFMSAQDRKTVEEMGEQGWCLAVVYNKRRERKSAISYSYQTSFKRALAYQEDLPIETVMSAPTLEQIAAWDAEFDENVIKKSWQQTYFPTTYGKSYGKKDDATGTNEGRKPGLFGLSEITEATIFGLTVAEYRAKISACDEAELDQMEDKIMKYWDDRYERYTGGSGV